MFVPSSSRRDPAEAGRRLAIIWIAFLAASLFYGVIAFVLAGARPGEPRPIADGSPLKYAFYAAGGVLFVLALFLKRRLGGSIDVRPQEGAQAAMSRLVVGLAVMEAVSIVGLLLVVLGGGLASAVPLLVGGPIGILLLRPGRSAVIAP